MLSKDVFNKATASVCVYIYMQLFEKHNKNPSLKSVHNENSHSHTKQNTCLFIHYFFYQIFIEQLYYA